jgi:protease IV
MFASMAGVILAGILLFFMLLIYITAKVNSLSDETSVSVKEKSVLEITLDHPVKERSKDNPLEKIDIPGINKESYIGLNDVLKSIRNAATDEKISGIFLNLGEVQSGIASMAEIRNALGEFRKSNKFIYAYSESYSQGAYYLASVADKIFLYPEGGLDFRGIGVNLMFFKGALEKLELEPQIIRHGKFKSAVEPFMYDRMSPENREQMNVFIGSIWEKILSDISASRNISTDSLQQITDNVSARDPKKAVQLKLIDKLAYYDEVTEEIKQKSGLEEKEKIRLISLKNYSETVRNTTNFTAPKIAVIYASGDIVSGKGDEDEIGSEKISSAIRKARLDTTIKAIVLRVNSPGGSAIASDVIWRETVLAKKSKPFIVSMGDYAASGGYYIACAADTIVAQPNTITGSIGVFGLLFNAKKLFNNKLGITFDSVTTGRYANLGTPFHALSEQERNIIQEEVEKVYDTFLTHVAEGRRMNKADIDSIGQGRVWSGTDAKRLGLVDVLGGIDDAIAIAVRKAKLDTYRIVAMPEQKDFLQQIMEGFKRETRLEIGEKNFGQAFEYYRTINSLLNQQGVIARTPYSFGIR